METIEQIDRIPPLGASGIHIWSAELPECTTKLQPLQNLLCEEELRKAARFRRPADRDTSILARGALRTLLSVYTGAPAAEIEFEYSKTGKPHLVSPASSRPCLEGQGLLEAGGTVSFNVSHSGGRVVLAFGLGRQVGVDVEQIRRNLDIMSIAERYFTAEETEIIKSAEDAHQMFFHHWARKEAYVKAAGSGLFRELSSFSVPVEDGGKDGWFFHRLEAGSAYASAVVSDRPIKSVRCFDFGELRFENHEIH